MQPAWRERLRGSATGMPAGIAALLALAVLFEAPTLLLPDATRPTGEVLVLLTLLIASAPLGPRVRLWRRGLGFAAAGFVAFRVEHVALLRFLGDEPLLYDQWFLLRHLFVFLSDLWSWRVVGILLASALAIALVWLVTRWLCRVARRALANRRRLALALVAGGLWSTAIGLSFASADDYAPRIRWLTPAIAADIAASWRTHASVQRALVQSPYRAYASLHLARRPDVYWFFVESYGRLALDDPSLRSTITPQLQRMERDLRAAGWHAASALSRAPISGGRSWLAEASVLMGTEVRYEAVFHHLIGQVDRVPNLVSFLAAQGYRTILLAPADRVRPGVEDVNNYRYAQQVRFEDLDYDGPVYGWGIAPDQLSLERTHAEVLSHAPRPLFFNFHMVSSHTPWTHLPPLVDDWHALEAGSKASAVAQRKARTTGVVGSRLLRYLTKGRHFDHLGIVQGGLRDRYGSAILYDLELIGRYVPRIPGDAIVVVMGDHQPPFVTESRSLDVPVHVFARDPRWLAELQREGFVPGLLPAMHTAGIEHRGLFSLFVRTLARGSGMNENRLPAYRPHGAVLLD